MGFLKFSLLFVAFLYAKPSLPVLIGASLAVPGAGEYWMGHKTQGSVFLGIDAVLVTGGVVSYIMENRRKEDAFALASRHAGLKTTDRSETLLKAVESFRSRDGVDGSNHNPDANENYNLAQIRSGKSPDEVFPNTVAYSWNWGSSENPESDKNWNSYQKEVNSFRQWRVSKQVFIGALLLNRVVSVINVLRLYKHSSPLPIQMGLSSNTVSLLYQTPF